MKWFDSLFSDKNTHTSLTKKHDVSSNTSERSYRDIWKRNPILSLTRGIADIYNNSSPFSFRLFLDWFCRAFPHYRATLTRRHWWSLILLLMFAYFVYSVGFIMRTDRHIEFLSDHPWEILTENGLSRLRLMRQDYQILSPLIQNPIFPLQPFATYGRALQIGYDLFSDVDRLLAIEWQVMRWKETSATTSIFPIVDDVFSWMRLMDRQVMELFQIIGSRGDFDMDMVTTFWANIQRNRDTWYTILGKDAPTRILLLNQNSDELRAGGGFPGTAFIIEFDGGRMTRFQFYDIYALDWHLRWYRPSPEGINRFRSLDYPGKSVEFEIRDANYYPRFHDSTVKLDELALEAGIWNIDLVIGINQKFLEDLVRIVEPISVPWINIPIDHRNVTLILSMLVEWKKTLQDTPKWTVKILANIILQELQKQNKQQQAILLFASHVYQGEFVMGSPHPDIQTAIDTLGIFDRWQTKKWDWVYPLFTSISRNKSDRLMERTFEINHTSQCERTLTLRQKHWFDLIEEARIRSLAHKLGLDDKIKTLLPIQGWGDNAQYLRFILPPGTQLLPKSDPDFTLKENNSLYTTIHGYETTSPGTTRSMSIHYMLPTWYCDEKTEFFKQPGLRNTRVVVQKNGEKVYQKFYE
jgi:hypothetical protein